MPKQLSDLQQRFIFGALIIVLVAFGIYLGMGGFQEGSGEREEEGASPQDQPLPTEEAPTTPPSPIQVTDEEDLEVFEWLPFPEDEIVAAALTAREFTAAYGTFDYSEPEDAYYERMSALAADDYADSLPHTSGAGALRGELEEAETVSTGRAEVVSIRDFVDDSIVFVVEAQSITEDADGARETLGEFAVTTVREGGEWKVYDFQPADAGDFGEE